MGRLRNNRHWEEELLAEYLATHQRDARVLQRVRLGPHQSALPDETLDDAERRMLGASWRRWADAVIIGERTLTVVEAAMIPDPGDVSRLETYLLLLPHTPELEAFRDRAPRALLVWAVGDPFTEQVARRAGVQVAIFRPSNWTQFISVKRARETGAPRAAQVLLL
jgi:hypothetical protein